jgi:hypothetical protein
VTIERDAVDARREVPRPKVLFIGGWTRSGSTLLDVLVGAHDGFFSSGELSSLWERGLIKGRQCGCGRRVRECPVWTAVLQDAYGAVEEHARRAPEIFGWQREAVRLKHLRRLLSYDGRGWEPIDRYVEVADALYRSIANVSGARVIVDSSKNVQDAAVLRLLPSVDAYLVHLVRDPRAVAHSMQRRVMLQADDADPVKMPRSSSASSAAGWLRVNLAAEIVRRRYAPGRSMRVRYEDLAADPRATLASIARFVGEEPKGLEFVDANTVVLHGNHTVWGNSSRFRTGRIEIRADQEWTDKLRGFTRVAPTALALPLLARYGYPITPA